MKASKLIIASKLRKQVESYVKKRKFNEYVQRSLNGFCAITSATLTVLFKQAGYEAEFICGHYNSTGKFDKDDEIRSSRDGTHCWVLSGGKIWDLTATQFDRRERIFVTEMNDRRYYGLPMNPELLIKEGWPDYQQPKKNRIKILGSKIL